VGPAVTDNLTPDDLLHALSALRGRTCWSVLYGPSTGRTIQLQFEEKIRRSLPVDNDAPTEDERLFDAEYVLYVACAWRLETAVGVL
jgi:hypothetical protein